MSVIIIIGIVTRISNYIFLKYLKKQIAINVSYVVSGTILCFIAAVLVGFDVVISEYFIGFLIWYIFDLRKKSY